MKKIFVTFIAILIAYATLFVAPVTFAATCGTDSYGKPLVTSVDYNCGTNENGKNTITSLLLTVINFLAIGVGIAVVGGIVWGSIWYISANGNAGQAQQGITIITNAIIGLIIFMFMWAIINFLVPGGVFS